MNLRTGCIAATLLVLAAGPDEARTAEPRTWYVYCEGGSAEGHWAVFSENFWPHPETADYGRLVGSAAKAFFESRHDLSIEGCAGVNFRDDSLAEHSRSLTVQLHRRMGDRIYFLPLPAEIIPTGAEPASAAIRPAQSSSAGARTTDQVASGHQAVDAWSRAPTPPR
jgi:hypothetical protein